MTSTPTTLRVVASTALALAAAAAQAEMSAEELAKLAQNPVGNLISLPFQNNTNFNTGPLSGTQNSPSISTNFASCSRSRSNSLDRFAISGSLLERKGAATRAGADGSPLCVAASGLSGQLQGEVTAALGALVGMLIVGLGVKIGVHYLPAQVGATLFVLGLTFAIHRHWTFR